MKDSNDVMKNLAENMRYYNAFRSVPQNAQKEFNNGKFKGTDINPMWRIQKLTEAFGACGKGWYYTIDKQWTELVGNEIYAFCNVSLYVKFDGEWSAPIQGTGGNFIAKTSKSGIVTSDEGYKMALTDAVSIACKQLGIGADIWFNEDKTKYTQQIEEEKPKAKAQPSIFEILDNTRREVEKLETLEALTNYFNQTPENLRKDQNFVQIFTNRKQQLKQQLTR